MTKSDMAAKFAQADAFVAGKKVKIDFGPEGVILLDGVAREVTEADGDADSTVKVSWEDWQALAGGTLNPMTAFMSGKLKVEGDMSVAMQLQSVLGKIGG
ncbi:SCP2 sterol-binding domain-containing protein [Sphingomonas montana]|uniref:SCP2 sterol-binding domain-containing protein n=1 Tax=Sphingomonas montana TaxID=1843236 RepID=UPI00096E082B|nr:SCP2 sterol-binding domain-containing protein [Sphingomonas montana]